MPQYFNNTQETDVLYKRRGYFKGQSVQNGKKLIFPSFIVRKMSALPHKPSSLARTDIP